MYAANDNIGVFVERDKCRVIIDGVEQVFTEILAAKFYVDAYYERMALKLTLGRIH